MFCRRGLTGKCKISSHLRCTIRSHSRTLSASGNQHNVHAITIVFTKFTITIVGELLVVVKGDIRVVIVPGWLPGLRLVAVHLVILHHRGDLDGLRGHMVRLLLQF